MGLKKLCSKCGKVIEYGNARCGICENKYQEKCKSYMKSYNNKDYMREYNKNRRVNQEFYNSKQWSLTRNTINNRDRGLCRLCYSEGKIVYSECVHHIEEVKDNESLRCDEANLISLCSRCHREVHLLYKSKASIIKEKLKDIIQETI